MTLGDYLDLLAYPAAIIIAAAFLSRIRITIKKENN